MVILLVFRLGLLSKYRSELAGPYFPSHGKIERRNFQLKQWVLFALEKRLSVTKMNICNNSVS
jgi:hypothetical protein